MIKSLFNLDWIIILCVLLLCGFGGAILASVSFESFKYQLLFYFLGAGFMFIFSQIDYRIYHYLAKPIYIVSLILLVITFIIGLESRGSTRWISFGAFRFQSSEFVKPFLIASMASFLSAYKGNKLKDLLKMGVLILVPFFLIFKQPDLGSALVFLGGFSIMVFAAGISIYFVIAIISIIALFIPLAWHFLADYQKQRIVSFFDPTNDPKGSSYNAIQAVITVGSGMILGRGLGLGTQSHLLFLPEKHTDFVFASFAEEFGLLGSIALLVLYLVVLWRLFTHASRIPDRAASLTLVGIASFILIQVFINVGMNIGVLPVTGITLPFISYGGSSVMATMIALGIAQNIISSFTKREYY